MKENGFIRVAAAVPTVKVGAPTRNAEEICRQISEAETNEISVIVFPELSVTGCTCADLFRQKTLIQASENAVSTIATFSSGRNISIVAGVPVPYKGRLYSCAAVIRNGRLQGIVPKTEISADRSRWFTSGSELSEVGTLKYAGQSSEISPDLSFDHDGITFTVFKSHENAQIILNPASDAEYLGSDEIIRHRLSEISRSENKVYVHASAGCGESTQDNVYAGAAYILKNGVLVSRNERFSLAPSIITYDIGNDVSYIQGCQAIMPEHKAERNPFLPEGKEDEMCSDALAIQVAGLAHRLSHINCKTAIIGISGGLDSTLALLVAALAFDVTGRPRKDIIGVTMPGFGTTARTKGNAWDLMEALGITCKEISVVPACIQHFKDIEHDINVHDATYENSQARERTQILMDMANKEGGIVIGTGDMSELALGWATYNGDHMSMYGVNAGVPKTMVKAIVRWAAENRFGEKTASGRSVKDILFDILDTPISPELLPATEDGQINQVTEDLVGPYELHDFFLYHFVGKGAVPGEILRMAEEVFDGIYDHQTIEKWLKTFIRRFFSQQFKRSCMPDGPQVCEVTLSPRGGWMMPSDAWSVDFML